MSPRSGEVDIFEFSPANHLYYCFLIEAPPATYPGLSTSGIFISLVTPFTSRFHSLTRYT